MKSRSEIWLQASRDCGARCSVSTSQDFNTVLRRSEHESDRFFTVTLPLFGKDFEWSLREGWVPADAFRGYKRRPLILQFVQGQKQDFVRHTVTVPGAGLPIFLGGFLGRVFTDTVRIPYWEVMDREGDPNTSVVDIIAESAVPTLLSEDDGVSDEDQADAVAAVRQLTLMFAKEKELCSDSAVEAAISEYVDTDKDIELPFLDGRIDRLLTEGRFARLRKVAHLLFGQALSKVDREIYQGELIPKHGPGATADSLAGNQKWTIPTWHERLEHLFPFGEFGVLSYSAIEERYNQVKFLSPVEEPPVKIVAVPKTQTRPRLIAEEPTVMQYIQQAISRSLVAHLEGCYPSKWFLGFTEQWPNQAMAQIGSEDGSLATLDLSEASDRVPNWLVEEMFAGFPWFSEGIQACRSRSAKLPSGEVIPLLKFASMGSATTFPIEAMVFVTVVIERLLAAESLPLTPKSVRRFRDVVRVYGDDIIVPTHLAEFVVGGLEELHFKVNRNKSFWTGRFRESCGKEYWKGLDVSIVKFRSRLPVKPIPKNRYKARRHDAREVISTVSTRNQLFEAGFYRTVDYLDGVIEWALNGHYPTIRPGAPLLGKYGFHGDYTIDSVDRDTQSPVARGYVDSSFVPNNGIDGEAALLKCLVETTGAPDVDDEHLTRSGRPRVVSIKLSMAKPY